MSGTQPDQNPTPGLPKIPGITLHHEIARGGMGVVYAGRQDFLDRRVAVKFLSVELGGQSFAQRFQREAKILAGIKHPNIVACHLAGTTDDGQSYLVMEFIDGPSLKAWIGKNGPMPPLTALRLVRATGQALGHAHQLDVIHRDVKPENILLETVSSTAIDVAFPYTPKLVDLGLARMTSEQAGMGLTSPGSVMGTPATMSPEQFDEPDKVDFRTDIYGLGCVLFEMLVGVPAFRGQRLTDIVVKKRQPIGPNPCDENQAVPASVGALVQQMLAGDRKERPGSYRELDELIGDLMQVLIDSRRNNDTVAAMPAGTRATIVTPARPGALPPPEGQPTNAPMGTVPAPAPNEPSGPGLLRTAELDFLSQGASGIRGAAPSATAFRDPNASAVTPAGAPPAAATGVGAAAVPAARRRNPTLALGVAVAAALAVGAWFVFGRGGNRGGANGENGSNGAGGAITASLSGPTSVEIHKPFQLVAAVKAAGERQFDYEWRVPPEVRMVAQRGADATFEVADALPEATFAIAATIREAGHADVTTTAQHSVVVADFPASLPMLRFREPDSRWKLDDDNPLIWKAVLQGADDEEKFVSCETKGRPRTCTTELGAAHYWEWSGTLVPDEGEDGYATMGLRFLFDRQGFAVWCTREGDGNRWVIEIKRAASKDGKDWEYLSLSRPLRLDWTQPDNADTRAWFSVQRHEGVLRFQVGEQTIRYIDGGGTTRTIDKQGACEEPMPGDGAGGSLTLFADQGIARFRLKQR